LAAPKTPCAKKRTASASPILQDRAEEFSSLARTESLRPETWLAKQKGKEVFIAVVSADWTSFKQATFRKQLINYFPSLVIAINRQTCWMDKAAPRDKVAVWV
jgi:hypothetical protein